MDLVVETRSSWVSSWGLVDLTFFLARLLWPFSVARLFGICFVISSAVSPGHVERLPLLIAVINVVGTGGKRCGGNTLRDLALWPWQRLCLPSSCCPC